jgi:CubicO group peptidase (beta-lactamase class C family)
MSQTAPNLYSGEPQHDHFCQMEEYYPIREMKPSPTPLEFPAGTAVELPADYQFAGASKSVAEFLEATDTSALLVLKDGAVCFEDYYLTGGRQTTWTSWSMAKSFVSALVGVAMGEGHIKSIDDAISQYAPALVGSGYEGVSIKDVLQMSSGALWNEDYSDTSSDVHRLGAVMAGQATLDDFVSGIQNETEPGTICQYNSADTQALGMLLVGATGQSLADYMQAKLFTPLGMESRGYWLLDKAGRELALGGLNMVARDFAKIGELYRNGGQWNGQQLVPADWVAASVQSDAAHLQVGKVIVGGHVFPFGYGYQWWVPAGDRGEFSAIGVYNQFVYVDPVAATVVVKLSANRAYGTSPDEATNRELETVEVIRAIIRQVATTD